MVNCRIVTLFEPTLCSNVIAFEANTTSNLSKSERCEPS
jgi:hypothetical protein